MAKLSIIVPTYNEVESLPFLADRIHACLCDFDYELIIVDDNSPDGTGALAEELAKEKPIKVVHREGKLGLASAVIDGFNQASGDVLGVIDADLQHPPEYIPELFRAIDGADIVIASRYVDGYVYPAYTLVQSQARTSVYKGAAELDSLDIHKNRDSLGEGIKTNLQAQTGKIISISSHQGVKP